MGPEEIPILLLIAAATVVGFIVIRALWQSPGVEELPAPEQREPMSSASDLDDGRPRCEVCGALATSPMLETGNSHLGEIPFLGWIANLHALPWKYTVRRRKGGLRLCEPHEEAARQRLEQFHGELRNSNNRHNALSLQKVRVMNQGGLIQRLKEDDIAIRRAIGIGGVFEALSEGQSDDEGTWRALPVAAEEEGE